MHKEYIQIKLFNFIYKMGNGIKILGTITKNCLVKREGEKKFRIILKQGLNRQIRRMCECLDYKVLTLTRVRIMHITLHALPPGKWRYFSQSEMEQLNMLLSSSSNASDTHGMDE